MAKLNEEFFKRSPEIVAKELLGKIIARKIKDKVLRGKIVETEAYLQNDPASHSFNGMTKRNEAMFGNPGNAYIYFTYGMHHCLNVVTMPKGIGEAVLIRALEPIDGIQLMKKRRGTLDIKELCSGPAKLVQAMDIHPSFNRQPLTSGSITICQKPAYRKEKLVIAQSTRIGITKGANLPLRFYLKDNGFVSQHKN
jgi:DNA-3-methyladenine glycosylase